MQRTFFERDYEHLAASEDACKVFGSSIAEGVATVGDIRKAFEGYAPESSVYPDKNKSGFYVADTHGDLFTV
jgi:hypothetical protein